MSFLNTIISSVGDDFLKEELQDRVDIVRHKIKFMEKVPVVVLNAANQVNPQLDELLLVAGAELQQDPQEAKVVIYLEPEQQHIEPDGFNAFLDQQRMACSNL